MIIFQGALYCFVVHMCPNLKAVMCWWILWAAMHMNGTHSIPLYSLKWFFTVNWPKCWRGAHYLCCTGMLGRHKWCAEAQVFFVCIFWSSYVPANLKCTKWVLGYQDFIHAVNFFSSCCMDVMKLLVKSLFIVSCLNPFRGALNTWVTEWIRCLSRIIFPKQ